MNKFIKVIPKCSSIKYRNMKKLFQACYKGHKTKGKTSLQARDHIVEECAYNAEDTQILSWLSSQDMQCLVRIWVGSNELVQNRITHKGHKIFQTISIGYLCKSFSL
ncbi:hypothetical protein BDV41DRAFT_523125, partial [Aspergillus transmontanensis]